MIALRQIDDYLGSQEYSSRTLRSIPGLRDTADRLDRLHQHRTRLWNWAEAEAARQRAPLETRKKALQTAQNGLLHRILTDCQSLGVNPQGRNLAALQAAWPAVGDALHRHLRDAQNLGPSQVEQHTAQLQADSGMIRLAPAPPDPVVETARRIKHALEQATEQAEEIERVEQRIDATDPYTADQRWMALEAPLRAAGMVPVPGGPNARPELDADLEAMVSESLAATGRAG